MKAFVHSFHYILVLLAAVTGPQRLSAQTFEQDSVCYEVVSPSEVHVTDADEDIVNVVIPASVTFQGRCYRVSLIRDNSLQYHQRLRSAVVGAVRIGENAFFQCANLTAVTFTEHVRDIAFDAFRFTGLTEVFIPATVTHIGGCFHNCFSLKRLEIDARNPIYDSRQHCNAVIETQANRLIDGCAATVIPDGVTSIGEGAFLQNPITSISFPPSVKVIEFAAFYQCRQLSNVHFSEGLTQIGNRAFGECLSLRSVVLPASLLSVGDYGFRSCPLVSVRVLSRRGLDFRHKAVDQSVLDNAVFIIPRSTSGVYSLQLFRHRAEAFE